MHVHLVDNLICVIKQIAIANELKLSTRISAGVDDCLTFYYYMIPIDCKITKFSFYL